MSENLDLELADGSPSEISRRHFLKVTGAGVLLFFTIGDSSLLAQQRGGRELPADFNAFLRIGEDGRVSCYTGKIEMGQGVITSLAQMLAEELDVPPEQIDMVMGDTELCPWDMGTFGSMTTRFFGPALRSAGAEARQVMVELASAHFKLPAAKLSTGDGAVFETSDRKRRVTYADLAKGKRIERHLTKKPSVKGLSEFRVIGKPALRRDAEVKVTGIAKYAADIQLPGMLYAKILRPPAHGAKLAEVDVSGAGQVRDAQVIHDGDLVAVLHKHPDVAELALSKIKARFDPPAAGVDDESIFDHLLKTAPEGKVVASEGDVARKGSGEAIERTYLNDYVAHAPIEPHAAVVHVEGDKATVWASTQTPFSARDEVARELGCAPENVRVMPVFVGGGFGGKSRNLQVVEAARLSRLSGKPVQVAWTREEEFFFDSFRPAAIVKIRSGLTKKGTMDFWDYHVYFAGGRGAEHFYAIPDHRTTVYSPGWGGGTPVSHPFATGSWRAPANNTNTFARESQVDILAATAGADPVEFRLNHLQNQKMQGVLRAAAAKFGWTPARPPGGRGFGVALGIDAGTFVATMAEVEVDKKTGNVTVKRVVCAQDMGLCINPEGSAIQMEGCIMMGLGYALAEHIHFKDGKIFDTNFDTYELPRFSWMPKIETLIVGDKTAAPQGGGEPAIVTMGAVIANAVSDAIGARVYRLPMTPDRIKEAARKG